MKRFAILSLMVGLSAMATGLSAAPAGLVQSREAFLIERESAEFTVRPNVLADVAAGDVIATKSSSATVRTENTGTVVVSPASRVAFLENNTVSILRGSAVTYVPAGQSGMVRADDLSIKPVTSSSKDGHIVVVQRLRDGSVVVEAVRNSFGVSVDGQEERLATLSAGDKLVFVPTPAGWVIQDPVVGAPAKVRLVQDGADAAAEAVPQEEEDEEDRRRAWWFWPAVIGGGAVAAGGGYIGVSAVTGTGPFGDDDDDDDDDDDRARFPGRGGDEGFSPILPPGVSPDPRPTDPSGRNDWLYYYGFFGNTTSISVLR